MFRLNVRQKARILVAVEIKREIRQRPPRRGHSGPPGPARVGEFRGQHDHGDDGEEAEREVLVLGPAARAA